LYKWVKNQKKGEHFLTTGLKLVAINNDSLNGLKTKKGRAILTTGLKLGARIYDN